MASTIVDTTYECDIETLACTEVDGGQYSSREMCSYTCVKDKMIRRIGRAILYNAYWSQDGLNIYQMKKFLVRYGCRHRPPVTRVTCRSELLAHAKRSGDMGSNQGRIRAHIRRIFVAFVQGKSPPFTILPREPGSDTHVVVLDVMDSKTRYTLRGAAPKIRVAKVNAIESFYDTESASVVLGLIDTLNGRSTIPAHGLYSIGDHLRTNYQIRCIDTPGDLSDLDIAWLRANPILAMDTEGRDDQIFQLGTLERAYIFANSYRLRGAVIQALDPDVQLVTWGTDRLDTVRELEYIDIQPRVSDGKLLGLKAAVSELLRVPVAGEHRVFYRVFEDTRPSDLSEYHKRYAAADVYYTFLLYKTRHGDESSPHKS